MLYYYTKQYNISIISTELNNFCIILCRNVFRKEDNSLYFNIKINSWELFPNAEYQ